MSKSYDFGLALKHNYADFLHLENILLLEEINQIRNFWEPDKTEKATIDSEDVYDDELRKSSVMFIDNNEGNGWLYHKLATLAINTNNQHYCFDILGFHQELQLTKYTTGDFFEWHLDFGAGNISARKLSITIQLSDSEEYEGGDLQFMINQKVVSAPRKKGTVIIFPSFIMHRVTPITKGIRQSIVGWVSGPPYR
ncbi:MAG: 2OG-Fe(II) oxygenase [Flavobacteriales bacterium]|nr:2OG-Fe(II) oxygenase [Flavobacteriales bacterium]